jgi:hypothetical protein
MEAKGFRPVFDSKEGQFIIAITFTATPVHPDSVQRAGVVLYVVAMRLEREANHTTASGA